MGPRSVFIGFFTDDGDAVGRADNAQVPVQVIGTVLRLSGLGQRYQPLQQKGEQGQASHREAPTRSGSFPMPRTVHGRLFSTKATADGTEKRDQCRGISVCSIGLFSPHFLTAHGHGVDHGEQLAVPDRRRLAHPFAAVLADEDGGIGVGVDGEAAAQLPGVEIHLYPAVDRNPVAGSDLDEKEVPVQPLVRSVTSLVALAAGSGIGECGDERQYQAVFSNIIVEPGIGGSRR